MSLIVRHQLPRIVERGVQRDITLDATHHPHVLVFQISPVAIAQDLRCDHILPSLHVRADVKLCRESAPLAVAHLLPVDPKVKGRVHRLEQQAAATAAPTGPAVSPWKTAWRPGAGRWTGLIDGAGGMR